MSWQDDSRPTYMRPNQFGTTEFIEFMDMAVQRLWGQHKTETHCRLILNDAIQTRSHSTFQVKNEMQAKLI